MKNKIEKTKQWFSDHRDVFAVLLGASVVAGAAVGAVYLSAKVEDYNNQVRMEVVKASMRGATVLPNSDGSYWIIEKTS